MLKRLPPKKLSFTTITIRILTELEQRQVAGGLPTDTYEPSGGKTCSKAPIGACRP